MSRLAIAALLISCAWAQQKTLPNQAGNAKLSLRGEAITVRANVTALLGLDPGEGYIVVKLRATPQTPSALRLSPDDFTLISRKNGEKSGFLSAAAVLGVGSVLVLGEQGPKLKNATTDPRLAGLEAKTFPEGDTKDPVEGLLYFNLAQKLKPDQLGLLYSGAAGRLVIDFK
jgi:hypothetical protein